MPTIFSLVWYGDTTLQLKYYEEVVCAPFGRWVGEYKFSGAKLSVFHCGAKLSVFTWRCQIVRFYMTVPNCPRCQIVRFTWWCQIVRVPNCPFLHCGAKLSTVPNCPRCQIVLGSNRSASRSQMPPFWGCWQWWTCSPMRVWCVPQLLRGLHNSDVQLGRHIICRILRSE